MVLCFFFSPESCLGDQSKKTTRASNFTVSVELVFLSFSSSELSALLVEGRSEERSVCKINFDSIFYTYLYAK